jgi:hypothetical protein
VHVVGVWPTDASGVRLGDTVEQPVTVTANYVRGTLAFTFLETSPPNVRIAPTWETDGVFMPTVAAWAYSLNGAALAAVNASLNASWEAPGTVGTNSVVVYARDAAGATISRALQETTEVYDATISVAISQTSLFAGDASVVLTPTVYGTASVGSVWRYDVSGFSTGNVVTGPQTKSMNVGNYLLEASATLALDNSYVGRVFRKTFDVYCSEVTSLTVQGRHESSVALTITATTTTCASGFKYSIDGGPFTEVLGVGTQSITKVVEPGAHTVDVFATYTNSFAGRFSERASPNVATAAFAEAIAYLSILSLREEPLGSLTIFVAITGRYHQWAYATDAAGARLVSGGKNVTDTATKGTRKVTCWATDSTGQQVSSKVIKTVVITFDAASR